VALLEGFNTTLELSCIPFISKEKKKGMIGEDDWNKFEWHGEKVYNMIKDANKGMLNTQFVDFMIDLLRPLNQLERKFIMLAIKGFTRVEIQEEIRKEVPISNGSFYKIVKSVDYSRWGESYKKDGKVY
jgi:hypothetical protein